MIPGDLVGWPAISLAVLVPIVTNPLSMLVARSLGYRRGAFISHVSMLVPLLIVLYFLPDVLSGKAFKEEYPWVLPLGLELGFLMDSTSYPFALLITIMGFLSSVYSAALWRRNTAPSLPTDVSPPPFCISSILHSLGSVPKWHAPRLPSGWWLIGYALGE